MQDYIFNDIADEATFAKAVQNNFEREISDVMKDESPFRFSKRHIRRMKALLSKKQENRVAFTIMRRTAAVLAASFVIVSGSLLTVPEVRAAVGNAFVQWFEGFTNFGGQDGGGEIIDADLSAYEITAIPEGFEQTLDEDMDGISIDLYSHADGRTLSFSRVLASDSNAVNNEDVLYNELTENGVLYHIFTATQENRMSSVVWTKEGVTFTVEGELFVAQLLDAARSVQKN